VVTSYSVTSPLASSTYTCSRHLLLLTDVENSNTYIVLEEQACVTFSLISAPGLTLLPLSSRPYYTHRCVSPPYSSY
jgi:hypothetical protein